MMIRLSSRVFTIIFNFLFDDFSDFLYIVFQIINISYKKKIDFVIHFIFFTRETY